MPTLRVSEFSVFDPLNVPLCTNVFNFEHRMKYNLMLIKDFEDIIGGE